MTAARKLGLISIEDYLAGELTSPVKHEYLGGVVYAMAGARIVHSRISTNATAFLHAHLRGKRCSVFNSDAKVRVRLPNQTRFYYPDAMVVCRSNSPVSTFQDEPVVVIEVLSRSTRRTDEGEKKDAYLTIPSLAVYLLIEPGAPLIVAHRRTESGFIREVYDGLEAVVPLPEVDANLPLADVYADVEFVPEPDVEEDVR